MSDSFRALRLNKNDDGQSHEFVELTENDLMEGRCHHRRVAFNLEL